MTTKKDRMTYSQSRLVEEVREQFLAMEEQNGRVEKAWLVRSVMADHQDLSGPDREFALYCSNAQVTRTVEGFFREIKANETDLDQQASIEGFEYIRARYLVKREGEMVAVPVLSMTREEMQAKAEELRRYAVGALAHANELDRLADLHHEEVAE